VGFDSYKAVGGDEECDDEDMYKAEVSIVKSLLSVASDESPLVRAEVAVGR
jgi:regulator-associated protein of mTOR